MTIFRFARDLALVLVAVLLLMLYCTNYLVIPWVVGGVSMSPALRSGDRVLVDLWTYRQRGPRPGEVVLLDGPGDLPIVKRVVAGPFRRDDAPRPPWFETLGTEDWYEVEGDNREASTDSRQFGPVPRHRVSGRVFFRYWPPERSGPIR